MSKSRAVGKGRYRSSTSCSISLSLPDFFQRLHRSMQRMLVISSELGVCALERGVSEGLGLLDAVVMRRKLSALSSSPHS
jgi:hypothetical protein